MPDITSLIASIRKEVGGAEPGTLFGDVLELCSLAQARDRQLKTAREALTEIACPGCDECVVRFSGVAPCPHSTAFNALGFLSEIDSEGLPSMKRAEKEESDEH